MLHAELRAKAGSQHVAPFRRPLQGPARWLRSAAWKAYTAKPLLATRAIAMQRKTRRPMQFEITQPTRGVLQAWVKQAELKPGDFLCSSRLHGSPHLGTRQDTRILGHWVDERGLDRAEHGTQSLRKTRVTLICRRTKNLRAAQLPLGHSKRESTVRSLGIEVADTREIRAQAES